MALPPRRTPANIENINLISPEITGSAVLIADRATFYAPLDARQNYLPAINLGTQLGADALPPTLSRVINVPDGSITPIPISACLELNSTKGGFVVPRMTLQQRDNLIATEGMQVFVTTDAGTVVNKFNFFESGSWVILPATGPGTGNVSFIGVPPVGQFNVPFFADTTGLNILDSGMTINTGTFAISAVASAVLGNQLTNISSIDFVTSGNNDNDVTLGISDASFGSQIAKIFLSNTGISSMVVSNSNVSAPSSPSGVFEIQSNPLAPACFLNSRMSTLNVNSMTAIDGMQVYDNVADVMKFRQGGSWVSYVVGGPTTPIPGREDGVSPTVSLYFGTGFNVGASGTCNLGIGDGALQGLTNGNNNIWLGCANTTSTINNSNGNVIVAQLPNILPSTTLNNCTFIGHNVGSGFATNVTDCVIIGRDNFFLGANPRNRFCIGNDTICNTDDSMVLGGFLGSSTALNVGIGTQNPMAALHVNGGQIGRVNVMVASNSTYNVTKEDYIIGVQRLSATDLTINLPALSGTTVGQIFYVSDINGDTSGANAIRIIANSGADPINGNNSSPFLIVGAYISVGFLRTTAGYVTLAIGYVAGTSTLNIRDVTGNTIVLPSDYVINVTDTSAPRSITLPNAARVGESFVIKDGSGGAGTNNITITPIAGLIDGAANAVINSDYGSLTFVSDGSNYYTIAQVAPAGGGSGFITGIDTQAGVTDNLFVGIGAGNNTATGVRNKSMSNGTLTSLTSGSDNLAIGENVLNNISTGSRCISLGSFSLANNVSTDDLIAIGYQALESNVSGTFNLAIGTGALSNNSSGIQCLAIGHNVLSQNNANQNIAIGYQSMLVNTVGASNLAIGTQSLGQNNSGAANLSIGNGSLFQNVSGNFNLAIGQNALGSCSTPDSNLAIGYNSMGNLASGSSNLAIGMGALSGFFGTSNNNFSIGFNSMQNLASGANNTCIGQGVAITPTVGNSLTIIGSSADAAQGLNNAVAIGANSFVSVSNGFVLGDSNSLVGIGTSLPTARLSVYGGIVVKQDVTLVAPGAYTVLVTDYIVKFDTTAAVASALLPDPTTPSNNGQVFIFKDISGTAATNNITISVSGGATIDGAATAVINVNYGSITVFSDGTNYYIT